MEGTSRLILFSSLSTSLPIAVTTSSPYALSNLVISLSLTALSLCAASLKSATILFPVYASCRRTITSPSKSISALKRYTPGPTSSLLESYTASTTSSLFRISNTFWRSATSIERPKRAIRFCCMRNAAVQPNKQPTATDPDASKYGTSVSCCNAKDVPAIPKPATAAASSARTAMPVGSSPRFAYSEIDRPARLAPALMDLYATCSDHPSRPKDSPRIANPTYRCSTGAG
mmetsp:Transcript_2980/g.10761  ORF Transcript_2980/g.10761 Transcript_2980/m.10761 type:complete len:231 (-) Transcript_2980:985-1677(-)